jgi:ABC-type amino acid transport substrate-binding protein
MIEGSLQEKDLDQIWPHAVKIIFKTLHDALDALKNKQVDALCTDDVVVLFLSRRTRD